MNNGRDAKPEQLVSRKIGVTSSDRYFSIKLVPGWMFEFSLIRLVDRVRCKNSKIPAHKLVYELCSYFCCIYLQTKLVL